MKPFSIPSHRPLRDGLLLTGIIQALCFIALPEAAIAKDDCFCLRDSAENLLVGCKTVSIGKADENTVCFDQGKGGAVPVNITGWTPIPDGKPGCIKCGISKKSSTPFIIRNGNEEE
jgi:hypothetical protein